MKNIVILGASYAGISAAHQILKQAAKTGPFKLTLVSPNSHFYWSIASPRGLIAGEYSDEVLFRSIAPGFKQYPSSLFEFILGSAESLDVEHKKVIVSSPVSPRSLDYDFLILATGSSTQGGTPFKGLGSTEETQAALHEWQLRVKASKTIVLAGGGPTGVETAGELGEKYRTKKEVILFTGSKHVLDGAPEKVWKYAETHLRNLHVDLRTGTRVVSTTPTPDGRQELTLSDGKTMMADMYIPSFGVKPNSSYIPAKYLDDNGFVMVDEHFQVRGAEKAVWAIGDISSYEPPQLIYSSRQSTHLAKNVVRLLSGKPQVAYKPDPNRLLGFSIGKRAASGSYGNWKIPSMIICHFRKRYFLEKLEAMADGTAF